MVSLSQPPFGKPIQFKNSVSASGNTIGANAMISQFLNLKNNYREILDDLAGSDHHARRYFCYDDCAYIFDIKFMKSLIAAIEADASANNEEPNGCVVLFQGLRKSRIESTVAHSKCTFGRPTIIAAAYKQVDNMLVHVKVKEEHIREFAPEAIGDDEEYDAIEHPGNGNSGMPPPPAELRNAKSMKEPTVVRHGGEDEDTDYSIQTEFEIDPSKWI